jgi:hypothetical protein
MEDELKSFKISDQVKTPVDKPKAGAQGGSEPAPSAGFPRLEALIENESIDLEWIKTRLSQLTAIASDGNASSTDKTGARKASLAYKHIEELMTHLAATKNAMLQESEK